jgi:hypothetical protein
MKRNDCDSIVSQNKKNWQANFFRATPLILPMDNDMMISSPNGVGSNPETTRQSKPSGMFV